MERALLIALGGAVGTLLRYLTATLAVQWLGLAFPYGTLAVNLTGSFLIGALNEIARDGAVLPDDLRWFLTTGVLGGFTTYSAFSYETVRLMEARLWAGAGINVLVTTAGCLTLCFLGIATGRLVLGLRG